MPDWIAAILLGIIEGVTEFLPVSSTGHLVLAEQWLTQHQREALFGELFNVVIQSGAVLAVLLVFSKRVREMAHDWRVPATRDYTLKLAAAFLITAIGGLAVKKLGWKLPTTAAPVAWATLIGGVLFLLVEAWLRGRTMREVITWPAAVTIGVAQLGAGVFPGASRSGTTILIALMLGVARPAATEFSFLLGIPTLMAAGAYQILSSFRHGEAGEVNWALVAIGTAVSAISAFIVVKWLLRFVQSHTFVGFGWYRIVLGAAILLWGVKRGMGH